MRIGFFLYAALFASLSHANVKLSAGERLYQKIKVQNLIDSEEKVQVQLRKVKYLILNGQLEKAKFLIKLIDDPNDSYSKVSKRYLALIHFIQGNYSQSSKILGFPEMQAEKDDRHLCLLKLSNEILLRKERQSSETLKHCSSILKANSSNDIVWIEKVVELMKKNVRSLETSEINRIRTTVGDNSQVRIWLKLALYLAHEQELKQSLEFIDESSYKIKILRELMGLLYYRLGNNDLALKFLQNINSSNAYNIKGNIALAESKYELAYGHFSLAIKKKENSTNALERLIPLTWVIGDYNKGIELLNKAVDFNIDNKKTITLKSIFLMKEQKFDLANRYLGSLEQLFAEHLPNYALEALAYSSIFINHKNEAKTSLESLCRNYSLLSCYIVSQYLHFPDFYKIKDYAGKDNDYTSLANIIKVDKEPIKEKVYVDQENLDELDRAIVVDEFTYFQQN